MRYKILSGAFLLIIHSSLALAMFLRIHFNYGAQAEMAWMLFDYIDSPMSSLGWNYVAHLTPFTTLFDWGYKWGSGPNLRAFSIYLLFGGLQWYLVGWTLGFLFWPKRGWVALHRKGWFK